MNDELAVARLDLSKEQLDNLHYAVKTHVEWLLGWSKPPDAESALTYYKPLLELLEARMNEFKLVWTPS
jgi:hypothetical protein